jgi:ABC-type transporter Mla subunit MlaD
MSTPATQLKLGAFVLVAIAAAVAVALGLGLRGRTTFVRYHTYFDESVQGLELGSPVTFRGVRIGAIGGIEVAPDRIHIDVTLDIRERDAVQLDLDGRSTNLRARLETQGITGVKYVDVDPRAITPADALVFEPALRHIPARPSLFYTLEAQLERLVRQAPEVLERATTTLDKLGRVADDLSEAKLGRRLGATIDHADAAVGDVRRFVGHVDAARLPDKTAKVLDDAKGVLHDLAGLDEVIANARHAAGSLRTLLRGVNANGELERTLRELGDAARSLRELAEEIERDPDMLVKGRARSTKP